jgi:enterochelin esterase family protein
LSLAIHELLRKAPLTAADVDAFLEGHRFPLVEDTHATFVYRGEASEVRLRHWVYGLQSAQPFHRVPDTDLWYHILELPRGSRVEYKFEVTRDGKAEWIRDPRNPLLAHDPFGANSVCAATGYERPAWSQHDAEARQGTLEDHILKRTAFSDARRLTVYLPARFRRTRRYPLLIVHDGGDYLRYAALKTVLDNVIHRLECAPLIAALTHPVDRIVEYPNDERHARFIVEDVLPFVEKRYPLYEGAGARCLMGASFGGVASFSTACRYPGGFGLLLLQSGSFAFTDIGENWRGAAFDKVVRFVNAYRDQPRKVSDRVFVSCGMYESLIYENRSMVPLLQSTGMQVRYEEARDGHNWENWRDRLRSGLSWLFPGPQWLVYE